MVDSLGIPDSVSHYFSGLPTRFPAAGNYNGGSVNNAGSNGNYWSSTPNDTNNAYNLNFNSGNQNVNNNNRTNGQSLRAVSAITLF